MRHEDQLVSACWRLLTSGRAYHALATAERALRTYRPPIDTLFAGRLFLIVGLALAALGRRQAAAHYLSDASWSLENARERIGVEPAAGRSE